MLRQKVNPIFLLLLLLLILPLGCEKINQSRSDYLVIPLGRSFLTGSALEITVKGEAYEGEYLYDSCGSYWLQIPKKELNKGDEVVVQYTRRKDDFKLVSTEDASGETWTAPSYYIDSDNEKIIEKAMEYILEDQTVYERARAIQLFVANHMTLEIYHDSFKSKASESLDMGYGTCMNYARLFVAIARAAGIPARTVWGAIMDYDLVDMQGFHHQWAEFRDEEGIWHPLDMSATRDIDLNDLRYIDLFNAPEENPITHDRHIYSLTFSDMGYPEDYPATYTGVLGIDLVSDERPDSMVVEYRYVGE